MAQNKMSSAKQTNKQVCAEASLLNKMEKKAKRNERKLEKKEWERKKIWRVCSAARL